MGKINAFADFLGHYFNLVLVENVAQVFHFVDFFIWLIRGLSGGDGAAKLDGWDRLLIDIELVVDLLSEVVTCIGLKDDWKVVSVPVIGPWKHSKD